MTRILVLALAVAAAASLAVAGVAEAHYLSGGRAYNAASSYARKVAKRLAADTGNDVRYGVKKPCSQRTAHRWVCDARFQFIDQNGNVADCTTKIISQFAGRSSYQVKAKGTGINCG